MASLSAMWDNIKKDVRKDMAPEDAKLLDSLTVDDLLQSDSLMKRVADTQLGPMLKSIGVDDDPLEVGILAKRWRRSGGSTCSMCIRI